MRIIAGKFKGRKIYNPADNITRPLKDRVRESIFNIIEHSKEMNFDLINSNVLDLYSGVGSFGLECLSRGARKVYFFENYTPALNILKKNVESLECKNNTNIVDNDVERIENFYKVFNKKINLVFLDPPFIDEKINLILNKIYEMRILSNKSYIIIHRKIINKDKLTNKFKEIRVETYGKSKIIFGQFK